jgi:hypothetical protein
MDIKNAINLFDRYNISYEEWTFFESLELRVDLWSLSKEQLNVLIDTFGEEIKNYDYLIVWH